MVVFFFIFGVIFASAAFFALMSTIYAGDPVFLIFFVILVACSVVTFDGAVRRSEAQGKAKHQQIYQDLIANGYRFPSNAIKQGGNEIYYTPQIRINEGGCEFIVDLYKYNGVWKPDIAIAQTKTITGDSFKVLSPKAIAKLKDVCNA